MTHSLLKGGLSLDKNISKDAFLKAMVHDPHLYVEDLDLSFEGRWRIALATQSDFKQSTFLDNRIKLTNPNQKWFLPTSDILNLNVVENKSVKYIFHISHVGSTLLSKLLGECERVYSLREPVILRKLAAYKAEIDLPESFVDPQVFESASKQSQLLLARPFDPSQTVIIKASSFTNDLSDSILGGVLKPQSLMIYCKINVFLPVIFKGNGWGDIISNSRSRIIRLYKMLDNKFCCLYSLSPGELIAMNWLCEMMTLFLAAQNHPEQVLWIDFDDFLLRKSENISVISKHLGLNLTEIEQKGIVQSELFSKYSKNDSVQYDAEQRARDLSEVNLKHEGEIEKGILWLRTLSSRFDLVKTIMETFG
jgi:hypothetical protein